MQTPAFRHWLQNSYVQLSGRPLAPGTQVSRAANCSSIEQFEGDLDAHFEHDGMNDLLERLTYSAKDKASQKSPRHRIPINGDAVNGSSTYRAAANLYRKFRVSQENDFEALQTGQVPAEKATERNALIRARVGQRKFRYMVLERWDYRCALTKASILLTASHIKPWRLCSGVERLDAFNGICLSPVFDRAFDTGVITFTSEGRLVLSQAIPASEMQRLGIVEGLQISGLNERHAPYITFHQEHVWRRPQNISGLAAE